MIDWTGHWVGRTRAVVRPADTEQVAAVLRVCHRAGVAVVPQGGNTGLVGGSVPMEGEVVLSTARLTRIEQVDPVGLTIAAGAGSRSPGPSRLLARSAWIWVSISRPATRQPWAASSPRMPAESE